MGDGGLEVRDLESTNGTYVNGNRVERALLSPGDRVQVGRVELVALKDE
jgi:pSer/pThr/pTyr-binding forkhead associated (FHA) protein